MTTLSEIANVIGGSLIGDPKLIIKGVSAIDNGQSGTITFISSNKYKKFLDITKASAIISNDKNLIATKNGIIVDNPKLAIIKIIDYFSLDNSISKHDLRLYGTECICKPFEILREEDNPNVILFNSPYKNEMKEQIKSINSQTNILEC